MVESIRTVGDLRRLIETVPDETNVYLWDVGIGGTVYDVSGEVRRQDCVEHSGKRHTVYGLLLEIDG